MPGDPTGIAGTVSPIASGRSMSSRRISHNDWSKAPPTERIARDFRTVARAEVVGHAEPRPVARRLFDVARAHLEAVVLEVPHPVLAAPAAFRFPDLDDRLAWCAGAEEQYARDDQRTQSAHFETTLIRPPS